MHNFQQVTPFLQVLDLTSALHFFVDFLGFEVRSQMDNYAYVQREGVAFRMVAVGPDDVGVAHRGFAYYIDVQDVDAVVAELSPKRHLLPHPVHDWMGPANQPYGQRELMLRAPDGNVLVFGQRIGQGG